MVRNCTYTKHTLHSLNLFNLVRPKSLSVSLLYNLPRALNKNGSQLQSALTVGDVDLVQWNNKKKRKKTKENGKKWDEKRHEYENLWFLLFRCLMRFFFSLLLAMLSFFLSSVNWKPRRSSLLHVTFLLCVLWYLTIGGASEEDEMVWWNERIDESLQRETPEESWVKLAKPSVIPIDLTVKLDHQWTSHKNVSAGDDSLALAQPRLSSFLHIAHFSLLFHIFLNEISVRINGYKWDEWEEKRESEENDRQKKRFRSGRSSRVGAYQREIVVLLCTCGSRVRTGKTVLKFFIILYWIALMGSISGWWWSHTDLHWSSCRLQLTFLSALLLSFFLCCLSDRSNGGKLCVEHWKTWIISNVELAERRKRFEFIFCLN